MSDPVERTGVLADGGPEPDPSLPPRILSERYLLEERIAIGGMATVWRAHDEKLARTVGVKLLHRHLSTDNDFRGRFRREAIAAAKLAHPGIVALYDTGRDGDWVYLVMEYVEGVTLREVMVQYGALDPGVAASIGARVARALGYAHRRGLVHRDIKPANVLLGQDGAVKLADFGIVKVEQTRSELTRTGMVLGTAAYVAPEQVENGPIDGRADQYGLGCVLYEALSGNQPFHASSAVAIAAQRLDHEPLPLRSVRADTPRELDRIVMRALARDRDRRFEDCDVFADNLEPWAREDALITQATQALTRGEPTVTDQALLAQPVDSRSFLRSEGRWLASVVALVILSALLTAIGVATGVIEVRGIPNLRATDGREEGTGTEPSPEPVTLQIAGLSTLDPQGDPPTENDERLGNMLDGNPDTWWRTDQYNGPDFGRLKDGLGVVVDLGRPTTVTGVTLATPSTGINYELRVANEHSDDPNDWRTVGEVTHSEEMIRMEFSSDPVTARYLLIWIVPPLQDFDGGWVAAFSDLSVEGIDQ